MRLSLKLICIKFNVPICWKHNNCHLHGVHVCIAAPVPMVESFCPFLNESIGGICVQSCTTDNDCSGDQLCCSNGCGMTCTDPVAVPYYNIPPVCPQTDLLDQFGVCAITNQSCSNNSQCRDSELCCRSRCGKTCQRAVRSSTPCYTVNHQILPTRRPPGMYVPACTNDGLFSPIQCRASTGFCWCVNVRTGQPTTSYYPRGVRPQCSGEGIIIVKLSLLQTSH